MAKEYFRIYAVNETQHWGEGVLEDNHFEAAFGLYLIREDEATHICSFTPSSRADWLENAFIWDPSDAVAEASNANGELNYENGGELGTYLSFVDMRYVDRRFIGARITVNIDSRPLGGLKAEAYLDAIWEAAMEDAKANGGSYEPRILWRETFLKWEAEQTAKRRAQNVKPLSGREYLPLFVSALDRTGQYNLERAKQEGWA